MESGFFFNKDWQMVSSLWRLISSEHSSDAKSSAYFWWALSVEEIH